MSPGTGRIARRFAALRAGGRGGLIPFITAGDPDRERSLALLKGLARAGADLIEVGVPFSDPMADGPAIQAASKRALAGGQTLDGTLAMVASLREADDDTPVVLMGYYNPIYSYGPQRFARDAAAAGVDGLIVVDLPPEEDAELAGPAAASGLDMVRLIAPTTGDARLATIVANAGGFIYVVSITGVTGTASATADDIAAAVGRVRRHTALPVAVGFGVRTPGQAATIAGVADAAVVGSALVDRLAGHADGDPVGSALEFVGSLAAAVRSSSRRERAREPEAGRPG